MAVYFIRSGNHVKIGKSNNPWKRFDSLQTANVEQLEMLAIMPGDIVMESDIHKKFKSLSVRGEWFEITPELMNFINRVRYQFPEEQSSPKKSIAEKTRKLLSKLSGERDQDDWRFEIKRKPRTATRKNTGSTATNDWYYWVVRVNSKTGQTVYYGTLNTLDIRR